MTGDSSSKTSSGTSKRSNEEHSQKRRSSKPKATEALRQATQQLNEIAGLEPESVTAIRSTDNGWEVEVEVTELRRIPDTTSLVATYSVRLDNDGDLAGYERIRRYSRGQLDNRT